MKTNKIKEKQIKEKQIKEKTNEMKQMKEKANKQTSSDAGAKRILHILPVILLVVWMAVIFAFSQQPADESGNLSGNVAYKVCAAWSKIFHLGWDEDTLWQNASAIGFPVRKLAHMTEYGIFAVLAFFSQRSLKLKWKKTYLISVLAAAVYAMTDEFHQYFIPGRACRFTDVMIDTAGATIAMLIVWLVIHHFSPLRKDQNRV